MRLLYIAIILALTSSAAFASSIDELHDEILSYRVTITALRVIAGAPRAGDEPMTLPQAVLWIDEACKIGASQDRRRNYLPPQVCAPAHRIAADLRAAQERKASMPQPGQSAISLCQPPRRMTPQRMPVSPRLPIVQCPC